MHLFREAIPFLVVALNLAATALVFRAYRQAQREMTPEERRRCDRELESDLRSW